MRGLRKECKGGYLEHFQCQLALTPLLDVRLVEGKAAPSQHSAGPVSRRLEIWEAGAKPFERFASEHFECDNSAGWGRLNELERRNEKGEKRTFSQLHNPINNVSLDPRDPRLLPSPLSALSS